MKEINNYLLVYGTLLLKDNEFAAYLHKNCAFYGAGKVKGKLYDLGQYPGVVLQSGSARFVYGQVYFMDNPKQTLKILDHYEGISNNGSEKDEYVRKTTTIETPDSPLNCWIYEYNLPTDGLKQITSGDYIKYLNENR